MRSWSPHRVAEAARARLVAPPSGATVGDGGPERVAIDSREAAPGTLFVGLPGERVDGGRFAAQALAAGAWGVLVAPEHAEGIAGPQAAGAVLAAEQPLAALQALARAWRRELACSVIGVTGSTGKTSTKDILTALLAPHRRTVASRENFNTEIGLPLELLRAPAGTEALVLEMGMRGSGQIAELTAIAEPDVGLIINVGPVHLEQLGSLAAVAAAKAELIAGLRPGGTAVLPAGEALLERHRRDDVATVTFGPGGDVRLLSQEGERLVVDAGGELVELEVDFPQAHLRANLLAALAAARAIGVRPAGRVAVAFSSHRGRRHRLANGVTVIDDCYNANPMSMRAALDDLAATAGDGRRVAVLGDMLELGPRERAYHAEIGAHAADRGVDLLVAVGPLAAAMVPAYGGESLALADAAAAARELTALLAAGDTVLVKGSYGVGLRAVTEALTAPVGADH
ncbi:MAG: UDP-N-acetylmuramoyl-tripeptide--D-alanyl-D-alanine ligase [Conexibacter sp.]|nr:UDP-N-acetylmuramoyl-tripeptide--D-alanyl-D-alanine ligase [Conexibacter sp.]